MVNKFIIILSSLLLLIPCVKAQSLSGKDAFAVLNLYNSAQMTSRGLNFIPRFTDNAPSALTNPSVLDSSLNGKASVTYTDLFASAYQGALAFTHTFKKFGNVGFGLQYINYGSFKLTEYTGEITGNFSVNDFMLSVGWGKQIEKNLYIGATFKPLFSFYESYTSVALTFDISATYVSNNKDWQGSVILKNAGRQIHSFHKERDTLPFDIQIGISKQMSHAPLIFYVVAHNTTKWNIKENDKLTSKENISLDGDNKKENKFSDFLDNGFRHLHFAVDITPRKQHKEMNVDDVLSFAGLSYGIGIKWKQFTLNYARNEYHAYGSPNYITLGYTFSMKNNESIQNNNGNNF